MKHACEEVAFLVSESLERKLHFYERVKMKLHFLMCAACKHYESNTIKLHQIFELKYQKSCQSITLPQEKKNKIRHEIQQLISHH